MCAEIWCFWPLTASTILEVKKYYAHAITQGRFGCDAGYDNSTPNYSNSSIDSSIKISLHSINLIEERSKWWFITIIVFGMVLFYHEYFEYEISNLTSDLHCNHTNGRETVFHRCESSNVRSSCPIARPWSCTYCRRRVFPYAETISRIFFKHTFNISISGKGIELHEHKILSNCCRHNYDGSISQKLFLNFPGLLKKMSINITVVFSNMQI